MHTTEAKQATTSTVGPIRERVHDLRNLFAVVACAKSLLERPLNAQKERLVLDALARVAIDGKIVTDALLIQDARSCESGSDGPAELRSLAPIMKTLERPGLKVNLSLDEDTSWIRIPPAEFRAVSLELVTNAAAAGATRIEIRAVRRGCRFWLIVADNGAGFATQAQRPAARGPVGLHGTGMRRLASAASSAHGKVKIRSSAGRGSVIALILPVMRIVPSSNPDSPVLLREAG